MKFSDTFQRVRALFGSNAKPISQNNQMLYPRGLKSYGKVGIALGDIYQSITGAKKTYTNEEAARLANYYLNTNGPVQTFVREIVNHSIGSTLGTLQSKVNSFSPEQNQKINSAIEKAWFDFTQAENLDISGRFDITEFLSMAVTKFLIEGEFTIRVFKNQGKYGALFQLLDFETLEFNRNSTNTFHGVEIDLYTKPIAYWLVDASEKSNRIDKIEFLRHANYLTNADVTNYRGMSYLTPAFSTLQHIDSYINAQVVASINEATKVIYYKSGTSKQTAYTGAATPEEIARFNPNAAQASTPASTYDPQTILASSGIRHGGIAIEALPGDVDLGQLNSNFPNTAFADTNILLFKILGSALGIPYSTMLYDLADTNYSSMRSGEVFKRPVYRRLSNIMINKVLMPMFDIFITSVIKSNPGIFPKVNNGYEVYKNVVFPLPRFEYINPKDDIEADILALDNGLKLWSELLGEYNWTLEDYLNQKKLDDEQMTMAGINLQTKQDKLNALEVIKAKASKPSPITQPDAQPE